MKRYFLPLLFFFCLNAHSQIYRYAWHHQIESTSTSLYTDMVVMDNNDLILCGNLATTGDVDPAINSGYFISGDKGNTFLTRIRPNGDLIWVVQFDSSAQIILRELARDATGDIYVCGYFSGVADMDPSDDTLILRNSSGQNDVFFAKYSGQDGHLLIAKSFGSTQNDDIRGIAADDSGNIFITGPYTNSMDFDPSPAIFTLPIASGMNACVAKYDQQGNFLSANNFGNTVNTSAFDIVIDSQNRIYVFGSFGNTVDFDPGAGTFNLTGTNSDGFLMTLSTSWQLLNAVSFNGTAGFTSGKLEIDPLGKVIAGGVVSAGNIDFDGSADTAFVTASGLGTIFITRQDSLLQYQSAWLIAGSNHNLANFSSAANGDVFMLFGFTGSIDIDPGLSTVNYNAINGYSDLAVGQYSPSGQYLGSFRIGNGGSDYPWGLAVTSNEKLIYSATFQSLLDVDPGADTVFMKELSSTSDAYIAMFDLCVPPTASISPVICKGESYSIGAFNLTDAGDYQVRLDQGSSCDSIINVHLTVVTSNTSLCLSDTTLRSDAVNVSYQWIDCDLSAQVGSGQPSFEVPDNNGYAVVLNQNGCVDTSTCIQIYQRANEQRPVFAWANTIPFNSTGFHLARVSKAGNIYVAAVVSDSTNFELTGGRGHYFKGDPAYPQVVVVKYDENRNYIWGFSFGLPITQIGQNFPDVFSMYIDDEENLYLTGQFNDSIDIDPSSHLHVLSAVTWSKYIAKFSPNGQLLWADQIDINGSLEFQSVFTDNSGHLFCSGYISGNATIHTGAGTVALASGGGESLLVLQLDAANGNYLFHFLPLAASFYEAAITDGTCDHDGNIIFTGYFGYTIDFDPGAGTSSLSPFLLGQPDGFVVKYTPAMQLIWAKKKNAITGYQTFSVVTDCDDNVYVSGSTPYLYKYDSSGTLKTIFPVSGQGLLPRDLAIDELNNLYVLYTLYDNGGILGTDTFVAISNGYDIVVSKFRSDGHYDWGMQLASTSNDYSHAIDVDENENIFFSGSSTGILDADAGPNVFNIYPTVYPSFLVKYGQTCGPVDTSIVGDSLMLAAADTNSYYQWIDCVTGAYIPGANSYALPPDVYGSIRLIVYQGDCIDTSSCYFSASTVGLDELDGHALTIYPNPVSDDVFFRFNTPLQEQALLTIINAEGKEVYRKHFSQFHTMNINVGALTPGLYTGVITCGSSCNVKRFVKK